MRKRFIARRWKKSKAPKIILWIIIIYIIILLTVKVVFKAITNMSNESNVNRYLSIVSNNMIGDVFGFDFFKLNLMDPNTFLKLSYSGFNDIKEIVKEKETVVVNTDISEEPIIYIYNTHQSEEYSPGSLKEYNIIPTVYMASNMLRQALLKKGINSIVENANIKQMLTDKNFSYNQSYYVSRELLDNIKIKHPSIKYYIDIHRDSSSSRVTLDDVTYAKLMFVVGMNHDNYGQNENLTIKLQTYIKNQYDGVIKNIFYGKNSRYNQDFDSNTILIEIGGPENTIDEVYNSVNVLAEALSTLVGGV